MSSAVIGLIIDGVEILSDQNQSAPLFRPNQDNVHNHDVQAIGASPALCNRAVESSARAFTQWKQSSVTVRAKLFLALANVMNERFEEIQALIEQEISCTSSWARFNVLESLAIAEQCAACVASGALSGHAPVISDREAHAIVIKEPLGMIVAIAPWNEPLILGLRAVGAAVAAGNTAVFKGSEISPRTHFLSAKLFQEAGFSAGVVNYIQHRPEDAAACFEAMISHKAVQKCNFTGSTPVGRQIAQRAAFYLKPVTLELGGKNFAIVTEDADLEKAADCVLLGAFLNSGQICMSTDLVLVARTIEEAFRAIILRKTSDAAQQAVNPINKKSEQRIDRLIADARSKGASSLMNEVQVITILDNVSPDMEFWHAEAFGPVLGLAAYDDESSAVQLVNDSPYGLSAAVHSRNHLKALGIAKQLETAASM